MSSVPPIGLAPGLEQQLLEHDPLFPKPAAVPSAVEDIGLAPGIRQQVGLPPTAAEAPLIDADRERRLMDSYREAFNTDPEFQAEAMTYASELGVTRQAAAANMELAKRMVTARALRYQELKTLYPTLLEKFSDVDFAAVAHDDLGNLKATESTWQWLGRNAEAGLDINKRGYLGVRKALGWLTDDEQVDLDFINVGLRGVAGEGGFAANTAQVLGQMAGTVPLAMGTGATAATIASLGGPVSAGSAFAAGTGTAAFTMTAVIEGGNAYLDMIDQGIDHETAAKAAFGVVAPLNGALEAVGLHYFATPFRSAFGRMATKAVAGKLASQTAGSAFQRFVVEYAKGHLAEVGTEVMQEVVGMSAAGVARASSRPDLPAQSWSDIFAQLGEISTKTAQGMSLIALPGPAMHYVADSIRARQAVVEQEFLKNIATTEAESKVAKRAPTARLEYLAATAKKSGGALTYIRPEDALEQLSTAGLTVEDLAKKSPEIAEQIIKARDTQAKDAVFPTATYVSQIQNTEFGKALQPYMRLSENSMSLVELQEFAKKDKERSAEAQVLLDTYKQLNKEWADSAAQVRDEVRDTVIRAGKSTAEANVLAEYLSAFIVTQAHARKVMPHEFAQQFPLLIQQEADEALQAGDGAVRDALDQPNQASLSDVIVEWDKLGIESSVFESGNNIEVGKIVVPKSGRGHGVGSGAMERLVQYADASGKRILLTPSTDFGASSVARLVKFYRRFGFVENKGRNKDFTTKHTMIREPKIYEADALDQPEQFREGTRRTDTPEFREWFQDSKVVDEKGQPLVVYHGTTSDFTEFEPSTGGELGKGIYLTDNPDTASKFATQRTGDSGKVMPLFAVMSNPLVTADRNVPRSLGMKKMIAMGHDGVIFTSATGEKQYVVFNPTQIKSVNNRGTWSKTDPNILNQEALGEADIDGALFHGSSRKLDTLRAGSMLTDQPEWAAGYTTQGMDDSERFTGQVHAVTWKPKNPITVQGGSVAAAESALIRYGKLHGVDPQLGLQGTAKAVHDKTGNDAIVVESDGRVVGMIPLVDVKVSGWVDPYSVLAKAREQGKSIADNLSALLDRTSSNLSQSDDAAKSPPRGTYSPSKLLITLGKKADFSTLLHESAHHYLHVFARLAALPDATPQQKADMDALLQWFKIDGDTPEARLANWQAMTLEQQRKHHEAFAYNWEIWLHDGKAPNEELRSIFEQFRRWLMVVYEAIRTTLNETYRREFGEDLPVLTGEVRRVMERLIASEDRVAKGEAVRSMVPMFQTFEESGMSQEEWDAYQKVVAEAHEAAVTDLAKASMQQMQWLKGASDRVTKELQQKNKALRDEVEREVAAAVEAEPVYRALRWLRKGELRGEDGQMMQAERDVNHKLDRAAVMRLLPGRDITALDGMVVDGGVSPDLAAEQLGFDNGEALLTALLDAPVLEARIEADADELMLQRHGDLNSPEAREAAVEAALHNEARARFIATELKFLDKSVSPVRLMIAAAREAARQAVAQMPVRELTTRNFALAEARMARKVLELSKKGKSPEAAQAKRQQLLQSQMAELVGEARKEVEDAKVAFRRFFKPDAKIAKQRDVDIVNAARSILAWYGFGNSDRAPASYVALLKEYNPSLYEELEPVINRVLGTPQDYRSLTTDEFRQLVTAVDALWDTAKRSKQIVVGGKRQALEIALGELGAQMQRLGVKPTMPGETTDVTKGEKRLRGLHKMGAMLKRVEHWANTMDGGEVGPFTRYIWRPISDALGSYRLQRNKLVRDYVDLLAKVDFPVGRIDATRELGYTFGSDNGDIGKATLLGALLHTGNLSNLRKLLLGRGWGDLDADGNLDTRRWDAFLQRMIDTGTLTQADFDWAQSVWDLLESTKKQTQEAWHDINGFYMKEVEARPVTVTFKDGTTKTYRGGYVPAKVDGFMVSDASIHAKIDQLEGDARNAHPTTATGFGKQRKEGYTEALSLDVRKIASHIDQVIRFAHVQPAVRDVLRILRNKQFEGTLKRVDAVAVEEMLLPWLNRAAQQQTMEGDPTSPISRFWSAVRKRTGMSVMFLNISNALQQLTGYFPAALKVPARYLGSAFTAYVSDYKGVTQEAADLSEFMRHRLDNQTFDVAEAMNDLLVNPGKWDKIKSWSNKHAYVLQAAFQNQVDVVTWTAAYNHATEKGDAQKEAVAKADAAVRLSQGSLAPEDIARFEASTAWVKVWTQFSGYFNMLANLNASEYRKLFRELGWGAFGRKGAGRLAMIYMLGFAAPALVSDAIAKTIAGRWDDEDEDGYSDEMAQWFFASQAKGIAAMVPGFGPAASAVVRGIMSPAPYDDRMTTSPSISALESATFGVARAAESARQGKVSARNVRDVLTLLSLVSGLPLQVVSKPVALALAQ